MSTFPAIGDYAFLSNCEQNCLIAPSYGRKTLTEGETAFVTLDTWHDPAG
jgi:hypothetical protein